MNGAAGLCRAKIHLKRGRGLGNPGRISSLHEKSKRRGGF